MKHHFNNSEGTKYLNAKNMNIQEGANEPRIIFSSDRRDGCNLSTFITTIDIGRNS